MSYTEANDDECERIVQRYGSASKAICALSVRSVRLSVIVRLLWKAEQERSRTELDAVMALAQAVRVLAMAHTIDDEAGFAILDPVSTERLFTSGISRTQYLEAWHKVRQYLFMQTEPSA